jgi:hypothetical protein
MSIWSRRGQGRGRRALFEQFRAPGTDPTHAPRRAHRPVWPLRPPQPELKQRLSGACSLAEARCVRADERRVVARVQRGRLQHLADAEGTLDAQKRRAGEDCGVGSDQLA